MAPISFTFYADLSYLKRSETTKKFTLPIQSVSNSRNLPFPLTDTDIALMLTLLHFTVFENQRKSLIQHCERSELRLHFEWTKVD